MKTNKPKTFKAALKKRNSILTKYRKCEKQFGKLRDELSDADAWCNHLRTFDDKWEPVFRRSINFSGWED